MSAKPLLEMHRPGNFVLRRWPDYHQCIVWYRPRPHCHFKGYNQLIARAEDFQLHKVSNDSAAAR